MYLSGLKKYFPSVTHFSFPASLFDANITLAKAWCMALEQLLRSLKWKSDLMTGAVCGHTVPYFFSFHPQIFFLKKKDIKKNVLCPDTWVKSYWSRQGSAGQPLALDLHFPYESSPFTSAAHGAGKSRELAFVSKQSQGQRLRRLKIGFRPPDQPSSPLTLVTWWL